MEFPADKLFDDTLDRGERKEVALMTRIAQLAGFTPQLRDRRAETELTLPQFIDTYNFPLWLQILDVKIHDDLHKQLLTRFTRTTIFQAWSDAQDDVPADLGLPSGIVFYWANVGRHVLFHDRNVFPSAGSGQYFYRKKPRKLFVLQRLEDFIEEVGDVTNW
jgi:hypothetical protein